MTMTLRKATEDITQPLRREPLPNKTKSPTQHRATSQSVTTVLALLCAFRLANALSLRTFFQPDEYFQALEPAWQTAFGQGSGAWITWEWQYKLRSSLHPSIFGLGYTILAKCLSIAGVSPHMGASAVVAVPKVIQSLFAALCDWYAWRLADRLYGRQSAAAWSVLLMSLANPWQWYVSTRTFSNCLEATLTIAALFYWPWDLLGVPQGGQAKGHTASVLDKPGVINSLRSSLILAALAVLLRPTNVFIWGGIGALMVWRFRLDGESPLTKRTFSILVREVLICGFSVLALSLLADRQYFGEWTFPPYTFLHFNIAQSMASFYGQNDSSYYLSQGIPLSCTTMSPFVLIGLWKSTVPVSSHPRAAANALRAMGFAAIALMSALSFISHKEVRFIFPLIPIFHILAAPYITSYFTAHHPRGFRTSSGPVAFTRKPLLLGALCINLIVAVYLSYFHAAAPIQVMKYLRNEFERAHPDHLTIPGTATINNVMQTDGPLELFALFLTPCHTTPWRSHLVYPALRARALTCEPPLRAAPGSPQRIMAADEGHFFDDDRAHFLHWLRVTTNEGEEIPRYIIGFERIEKPLQTYFGPDGPGADWGVELRLAWSGWNGLFTDDDRKAGKLMVWDTGIYGGSVGSLES